MPSSILVTSLLKSKAVLAHFIADIVADIDSIFPCSESVFHIQCVSYITDLPQNKYIDKYGRRKEVGEKWEGILLDFENPRISAVFQVADSRR